MSKDDERVGANVRRLRGSVGLSQGGLADAMREKGFQHWRQTTVSRVERGAQPVKIGETRALDMILGGNVLQGSALDEAAKRVGKQIQHVQMRVRLDQLEVHLQDALQEVANMREVMGLPAPERDDE